MNWYFDKTDAKKAWNGIITRCDKQSRYYTNSKVCDEWKNYYNFEKWFFENVYSRPDAQLQVDKDLFGNGDRLYSPETCCMLPKQLNVLLGSCISRNQYLPGVSMNEHGTYTATMKRFNKDVKKTCKTEEEAFQFYKEQKEEYIKIITEAHEPILPRRIYDALIRYKVKPIRGTYNENYEKFIRVYREEVTEDGRVAIFRY